MKGDKKKILFIFHLPPPVHGPSVLNQAIMNSQGINTAYTCKFVNLSTAFEINDIGRVGFVKIVRSVVIVVQAIGIAIRFKPDLCYITLSPVGPAFYKDSLLALALKALGFRMCFHIHGKGIKKALNTKFKKLYYNKVFDNVHVIHLSERLIYDLADLVGIKKKYIVNNGVKGPATVPYKKESDVFRVLFLSNMVIEKGPMTLLEASKIMSETIPRRKIQFVFAGNWISEEFRKEFEVYIKDNQLEEVVKSVGPKYGAEKTSMLATSDVFVFPTYYPNECFPISILEAFSHALPVISSFEGAIPDIITEGHEGYLVEAKKPELLAEKISELYTDRDLAKRMSINAFSTYNERFTNDKFEQRLLVVFSDIFYG